MADNIAPGIEAVSKPQDQAGSLSRNTSHCRSNGPLARLRRCAGTRTIRHAPPGGTHARQCKARRSRMYPITTGPFEVLYVGTQSVQPTSSGVRTPRCWAADVEGGRPALEAMALRFPTMKRFPSSSQPCCTLCLHIVVPAFWIATPDICSKSAVSMLLDLPLSASTAPHPLSSDGSIVQIAVRELV